MKRKALTVSTEDVTIEEAHARFITSRKLRNLSVYTIDYYESTFAVFQKWMDTKNSVKVITQELYEEYVRALLERKNNKEISNQTVKTYLRSIRAFFNYCMVEGGLIDMFPMLEVNAPETLKDPYTDAEIEKLIEKPSFKDCSFTELRDWALINYILATGNRINSVLNVQIRDINMQEGTLTIRTTKAGRVQILPISNALKKVLMEYMKYRKGNPDDYLFCDRYGNRTNRNAVRQSIEKYNKKRGVEKTSLHLFRHAFAKSWIMNGGDPERLRLILGHSTYDTLKKYLNLYGKDLQKDYSTYSPLDNFMRGKSFGRDTIKVK